MIFERKTNRGEEEREECKFVYTYIWAHGEREKFDDKNNSIRKNIANCKAYITTQRNNENQKKNNVSFILFVQLVLHWNLTIWNLC